MTTTRWDQDAFVRALDFAAAAHGEQKVPGTGYPYLSHLVKVATETMTASLADGTLDADLAIACAVLHDSVEDAGVTPAALRAAFGPRVADGVAALTKDESLPKELRMADSLRRLQGQPREVQLVKLADRVTNLEPPPPYWSREKRVGYRDEARAIHAALASSSTVLAARLLDRIDAYAAWFDA